MRVVLFSLLIVLTAGPLLGQDAPQKTAAPTAEAQTAATGLIKEVYGAEWTAAKSPDQKKALAKKLFTKAGESASDKPAQYTLLRISADIATQAGELDGMLEAIDALDAAFAVDVLKMKADNLEKMVAFNPPHRKLSQKAIELSDAAAANGNYTVAKQLSEIAVAEARKAGESSQVKRASEQKARIDELAKAFEGAKAALDILEKTPDDPEANLIVGKYYCFAEKNWKVGLPALAKCSDPALKALAIAELKGAASSDEQVKLGDGWWDLPIGKQRAAFWYKQALPGLSGISKDKVTGRLATLAAAAGVERKWVDIAAKVDLKQHVVKGSWTIIKEGLYLKSTDRYEGVQEIFVPTELTGDYEMEVKFTRTASDRMITIVIPVDKYHCMVEISAFAGDYSGIEAIDGKEVKENVATVKPGHILNNRVYTVHITTKIEGDNTTIVVELDGKPYIKYKGPYSVLKCTHTWTEPEKGASALGGWSTDILFHSMRVMDLKP